MKFKYIIVALLLATSGTMQSCSDFLDKNPLGQDTDQNFYTDPNNAILAVNAAYDVLSYDEGNDGLGNYVNHNYEWMFGDVLSEDAEKGSTPGDMPPLQELKEWRATGTNTIAQAVWQNMFQAIYRTNLLLQNLENSPIDATLKNRLMGEAYFIRGYSYFYMLRLYGGLPLFTKPVQPSDYSNTKRSTLSETYAFIEADFKKAAELLPEKNAYEAADAGRATKGAANGFLARAILYQMGTDNPRGHTWKELYDLTDVIAKSGQYALTDNYAAIQEGESENNKESLFEIQFAESNVTWGIQRSGTNNNQIQNNRNTWGWGFNNPTQSLVNAFEANDPRKAATIYKTGDIVTGIEQVINFPSENSTGFLNRKAAIIKPTQPSQSPQNIRKLRYADVLLMRAEAAAHLGNESEARTILNQIRDRARKSTLPRGSKLNTMTYEPANTPASALPPIAATVTGTALLDAIYHERRVELGMEALHFWDQVRTGTYFNSLPASIRSSAMSHSIAGSVNPIPVLPIPANEVQSWGLEQNPGY
ncbi:RagB/SusD family nutrient uptake outer membrane protein [Siphonobacter curvatus]|uniref:RagB/SusD family nutrient uptake outer membrane protein n=1 Tax=Siphonobacter curvatus TaxID=2094562 RepID=A0A2S7IND9_9BACT|nr:RagB/SusD family nutrient uptake outer membrane protein [Siphonobacter curvatus]PQA59244.1 RagB/SusD family nutrient uptake outer membrane protein [Siphonobacter curvatus]